jgi:hypothetical protein
MVNLFANTLKDPYYEHVMGSSAQQPVFFLFFLMDGLEMPN